MTPKITHVKACPDHKLHVGFESGEARLFDVTPYLDKGVFRELRDEAYFQRVRSVVLRRVSRTVGHTATPAPSEKCWKPALPARSRSFQCAETPSLLRCYRHCGFRW